jgi:hypothetical protein
MLTRSNQHVHKDDRLSTKTWLQQHMDPMATLSSTFNNINVNPL